MFCWQDDIGDLWVDDLTRKRPDSGH